MTIRPLIELFIYNYVEFIIYIYINKNINNLQINNLIYVFF